VSCIAREAIAMLAEGIRGRSAATGWIRRRHGIDYGTSYGEKREEE
jgi:hypothetical protein